MRQQMAKVTVAAAALMVAGASALVAQGAADRGAFLVVAGSDTVVVEHFERVGDTLRGTIRIKGQPRQDYLATLGPRFTIGTLALNLFRDGATDTVPMQRIRITIAGDSAFADIGGTVQRFGTTTGAIAMLNNSFALGEQFTRLARAAGGTVDIPVWALSGGVTLTIGLRAVGADSMTLTVGGMEERLRVDSIGRILGGSIPAQHLGIIRVDAATAARLGSAQAASAKAAIPPLPAGLVERAITVPGPVPLPGTLTLPSGKGPFRGVVLVHGSGAGDRDETIGDNKPFRDIAWGLARHGIAVLRYDKRARVSPGWFVNRAFTVYDETIQDALGALTLMRQQPEVDAALTAVLGHSLGGMVAPRIALADPKLAGVVIMAGATRVELPAQMERQYHYIASVSGADSAVVMSEWRTKLAPAVERVRKLTPADSANITPIPGLGGTTPKYWLDLAAHDPAITMRKVTIPALVLQGMRDYQVPPDQLDDWLKVLGPHQDLTVKRYPALTHLMMAGAGPPRPAEYAIAGHVDTLVIADIARFIRGITPR